MCDDGMHEIFIIKMSYYFILISGVFLACFEDKLKKQHYLNAYSNA